MAGRKKQYLEVALFITVLVLGVFLNVLDNEATNWDDPGLFSRPALQELSVENVKQITAFTSASAYQPVRDLTYMLDFHVFGPGPKGVIFGMHLHNVILYLLMVFACWLFLLTLFEVFVDDDRLAFAWATLASILFAVHPVHVESVAWLYARKEPLLGLFTFLCMWAFIKARTRSALYYLASFAFLILAILSKPTGIVIPAVLIVLDLAIQGKIKSRSFFKTRAFVYLPMLVVAVPMGLTLVYMMHGAGGVKPFHGGSVWTNLLAVSQILMSYVSLIGFTVNYSADYPIKLFASFSDWQAWVYLGLNFLLIASGLAAFLLKRFIYAFFVAWYYVFLLPVAHIYPIAQILADRYALLSSLAWCVLLGYAFARLMYVRLPGKRFSAEFPLLVSIALFSALTLSYTYMTFRQNDIWKDSQTLWEDTLAKYPNSSPGNVNLAAIYLSQFRFPEVQKLCLAAIREKPYDYLAISNLALAQVMMGQYDHAINNYKQALKLKPDLNRAEKGLVLAYWMKEDYKNAYEVYSDLFRKGWIGGNDDFMEYSYRYGFTAWKMGKMDEAEKYLGDAFNAAPRNPRLLDELGATYTSMGNFLKAREAFMAFRPYVKEGESKEQLERVIELLDKRISGAASTVPAAAP